MKFDQVGDPIYLFCPFCGSKLEHNPKENRPYCAKDDWTFYLNASACAGALPVKDGKVLLMRRADPPRVGTISTIGGFVDPDENAAQTALREAKEETGLDLKLGKILGTYADKYTPGNYVFITLYVAGIIGNQKPQALEEVAAVEWHDIATLTFDDGFSYLKQVAKDLKQEFKATV